MTEKLKLTKEQSEAIEMVRKIIIPIEFANVLKGLSPSDILQAIKEGYDVEPHFKQGEIVKVFSERKQRYMYGAFSQIIHGNKAYAYWDDDEKSDWMPLNEIEKCTTEEIKVEKERRLWKKIGREVGEFREGDIKVFKSNTAQSVGFPNIAKSDYELGAYKGFYPVESFISFESGEPE